MPIFVYILLGIALLITLLLISKVKVNIVYDSSLRVYARFLFIRVSLFPIKPKIKKKKKKKTKKKKLPDEQSVAPSEKPKEKSVAYKLWEMKSALLEIIKKFLNKLHFRFITLRVVVACNNAAKTALAYAGVNQGIAYIIEILRNISNVEVAKNSDISVQSNFISQESEFEGKIQLYIRVISLIKVGIFAITKYFKIKSNKEV